MNLQRSSFGLSEVFILAICAGAVLVLGAVVVAVLLKKRRGHAQLAGSSKGEYVAPEWMEETKRVSETRRRRRWGITLIVIVVAAVVGPVLALAFGILWVTPVRQEREPAGSQDAVVVSAIEPRTDVPGMTPAPGAAPTAAPPLAPDGTMAPTAPIRARRDFLDPDNTLAWAIVLPSLAGLMLLAGTAAAALIGTVWKKASLRSVGMTQGARGPWARTRLVLLVLLSWFALGAFLVLDLLFAISLSYRFVALYAAFWVLVGALLLYDRPLYNKLVLLALLVIALWGVRFVDWNSRKPFLRDLNRIQEGMTPAQVDRVMEGYTRESGGGPPGSEDQAEYNEQGEMVSGWVTFRHTDKGWGDSDLGVVTVQQGRVIETEFLPD